MHDMSSIFPLELLVHIARYMPAKDLARFEQTCKTLIHLPHLNSYWERHVCDLNSLKTKMRGTLSISASRIIPKSTHRWFKPDENSPYSANRQLYQLYFSHVCKTSQRRKSYYRSSLIQEIVFPPLIWATLHAVSNYANKYRNSTLTSRFYQRLQQSGFILPYVR